MGLFQAAGVLALAVSATQAQSIAEYRTTGLVYKIAIPQAAAAPFDILFSITAPRATGWAGLAVGGGMLSNPLVVAWPNGNTVTVSPRWANAYSLPQAYAGATITVFPTSSVNDTHWTANFLCKGCSTWDGGSLNPQGANPLAWALSARAVANPASASSTFGYHSGKGGFTFDLAAAARPQAQFDGLVASFAGGPPMQSPPVPPASPVAPTPVAPTPVAPTPVAPTPVAPTPVAPVGPTVPVVIAPSPASTTLSTTTIAAQPSPQPPVVPVVPIVPLPPLPNTSVGVPSVGTPVAPLPPAPTPVVPNPPVVTLPAPGIPSVETSVVILTPPTPVTTAAPTPAPPAPIPDPPYTPPPGLPPNRPPIPDAPIQGPMPVPRPQPQPQPPPVAVPPFITGPPPWVTDLPGVGPPWRRPGGPGRRPGRPGRPGRRPGGEVED